LPEQPGVYRFQDATGRILYVGKAANLRQRVGSYFHGADRLSPRMVRLMQRVVDVEVTTTAAEAEALILESQLIKRHQPRYNVAFRDDKTYPLLKLTAEPFPRLVVTRRRKDDGARYFGPYADAGLVRQALQFFRRVFPLRTCRTFPSSPCLEYHLGQCLAPCVGYIPAAAYQRIVADLVAFLEGKREGLLRDLARRMKRAAADQRFEEAARVRDQIEALTSVIVAKEKSALAGPLEQLQAVLKLPTVPRRIEAVDISNIHGTHAVGSLVTFVDGRPYKAHYRRFKIKTVRGIDDYQMMREVIQRRYTGSLSEVLPWPDLILVDGGKGQLQAVLAELAALGRSIPTIGLAKQEEHIFVPDRRGPIVLLPTSPVLHLVQRLRDEAHRVAIGYHRRLRQRPVTASALDRIRGIGPKRKQALLSQFGSVATLRHAPPGEVARVAKLSLAKAEEMLHALHGSSTS